MRRAMLMNGITTPQIADSAVTPAKAAQPVVSALPTTGLVDGMEVVFQSTTMASLGIAWRFKYRAAASTYKWEFVGGAPLYNTTTGGSATCSTSFTNYTPSNYAQVTPPLAGLYAVTGSIRWNTMTQASATLIYHNLVDTNGTTIFSSQYASPGVSQFGTYYPGGMDTVTVQGQYLSASYSLRTGFGSFAAGNTLSSNYNGIWIQPIAA